MAQTLKKRFASRTEEKKEKDSKSTQQVTKNAVKTLFSKSLENRMSSENKQYHAGAFANCSVTFNFNYSK